MGFSRQGLNEPAGNAHLARIGDLRGRAYEAADRADARQEPSDVVVVNEVAQLFRSTRVGALVPPILT